MFRMRWSDRPTVSRALLTRGLCAEQYGSADQLLYPAGRFQATTLASEKGELSSELVKLRSELEFLKTSKDTVSKEQLDQVCDTKHQMLGACRPRFPAEPLTSLAVSLS